MKYIQTLTEKGKLKWHNSDAPEADGKFRDLSPKDLAAWLIKTRKGDMKRISGSLSQQVAFNQNDDKEYVKKMDKTRKEVYKQLDREDLLESVDTYYLDNAKEQLSNPHTILDITYDKTRRGDKFVRFDYENKYVPGKMLDTGPHFVKVFYDNNKDLKKISKELSMDLKESVLNEEDTWNDYPAAAKKNAQKAIDWKEEHGRDEVDAGTPVGWARAHQLAKGENLSTDTVKRMSAFNRHRKNSSIKPELKETPWKDKGYVAWLIWGGDEGVDWAIEKSKEIDAMKESKQMKYIKSLSEAKMPKKYIGNDEIVYLKTKEDSRGANYNLYYKGHDIDKGGRRFGSEKELEDFAANYILSNQWYKKLRYEDSIPLPESIEEAKLSKVHKAAKQGSYPAVIVVVQDGKVIHQEPVSTPDVAPATFNVMQKEYPKALLHLEDRTGKRLFSESVVNEARMFYLIGDKEVSRDEMLTYKYDNPDKPVAKEGWPKWLYTNNDPKGKTLKWSTIKKDMKGLEKHYGEGNVVVGGRTNAGGPYIEIYSKSQNESVTEGIYAKKSKIQVGEYIQTQYGYFYKRVEGKVGGQDAYVEIKKGKEGKRKTSIHDTVDFDIVDKSVALGESVKTHKYIKPINEYFGKHEYGKFIKEFGKIKYPKYVKVKMKELVAGGFLDKIYDNESNYMSFWLNQMGDRKFNTDERKKELGEVGYKLTDMYWHDLTGSTAFMLQGAEAAYEISKHVEDLVANKEDVEPAYYLMKEYFINYNMQVDRSRIFKIAVEKLEKWMEDNAIETL